MREPGGFPDHPHRGIETVTLVLDGELYHADNRGNSGVLGAVDVQRMTAGGGIVHAELPNRDASSHTLQLWLNLPASRKVVASGYQDLPAASSLRLQDDHASIRLISGELGGVAAPTQLHTPVQYLDVRVPAGGRAPLPVPAAHNGFVLVVEGSAYLGQERTPGSAGQVLWLDFPRSAASGESTLAIQAETPACLLVVTGEPLREPVFAYGPLVMNSQAEVVQAYRDFHSGAFGGPTAASRQPSVP